MGAVRRFIVEDGELLLTDALALYLAIVSRDDIATRQLLREYETQYTLGYGKQVLMKTCNLLSDNCKDWLRQMY